MSMDLDPRQRAMLAEMGIRVWQPEPRPLPVAGVPAPVSRVVPKAPESIANNDHLTLGKSREILRPVHAASPAAGAADSGAALPSRPAGIPTMDWPALQDAVAGCQACALCRGRKNVVFGVGDVAADWMVVGEAPGEQEDLQGEPFVGPSGRLLDSMLKAIGLSRHAGGAAPAEAGSGAAGAGVYIANVVKCRPPGNRNPLPAEVAQCEPYLARQVALVRPRIILAMGRFAVQSLLRTTEPIGKLRGRVHHYEGVPVIVTYHPAYLLRSLPEKAKAWADLCLAMDVMKQGG